jgi:hypothetical protein
VNEWLTAQWNRLRRKVDHIVVAALVVLLGVMVFFYWVEQQLPEPVVPAVTQVEVPKPPPEWTTFTERTFVHPKDLRKVPDFAGLMDFDMFDARSVAVQLESVAKLDQQYEKAQEAFLKNDLVTAERICADIIKTMPSHRKTVELLKLISSKKKEMEKEPTKTP